MQYIALIHKNTESSISDEEWSQFIEMAIASGMFMGGSEINARQLIGQKINVRTTENLGGFMRFDSNDRETLLDLLQNHPIVNHGGTIELWEMPKS